MTIIKQLIVHITISGSLTVRGVPAAGGVQAKRKTCRNAGDGRLLRVWAAFSDGFST